MQRAVICQQEPTTQTWTASLVNQTDAHLCPVNGVVVLGASLGVGVVHQRQVSQSSAPLSGGILPGAPPQQAHRHVGGVVVLKGDLLNLKDRQPPRTIKKL